MKKQKMMSVAELTTQYTIADEKFRFYDNATCLFMFLTLLGVVFFVATLATDASSWWVIGSALLAISFGLIGRLFNKKSNAFFEQKNQLQNVINARQKTRSDSSLQGFHYAGGSGGIDYDPYHEVVDGVDLVDELVLGSSVDLPDLTPYSPPDEVSYSTSDSVSDSASDSASYSSSE